MSLSKPLRDEFLRNRKRKQISLDGRVAGVQSSLPRGRPVTADLGPWGLASQEYIPPPPSSYDPLPGSPDFPEPEYDVYEPRLQHPSTPRLRDPGPERLPFSDATPEYNDSLMTDEDQANALAEVGIQILTPEAVPLDFHVHNAEIADDSGSLEALAAEMMLPDPAQQIGAAFDQQMQDTAEAFEPPQPEPMQQDPEELQQMYDEQQLMDPFGMMGPGPMM